MTCCSKSASAIWALAIGCFLLGFNRAQTAPSQDSRGATDHACELPLRDNPGADLQIPKALKLTN